MYRRLLIAILLGFVAAPALAPASASASNRSVEIALASYPDVSDFYQALATTGVLNQLDENMRYTIFAPTNTAFAEIRPNIYPCFYAAQCRPQIAEVLRNHIIAGPESLKDLVHEPDVQTIGRYRVLVESPYVGNYTVANRTVLTGGETAGNRVYRIDGVIVTDQQLAQFRSLPPVAEGAVTGKRYRTYRTPVSYPVSENGDVVSETVVKKTYVAPETTVVAPRGSRTITTHRTYVTPEGYKAGGEITTITRTTEP